MPDEALDIAQALEDAALGVLGSTIFISTVVDDDALGTVVPDAAIFVWMTSGATPEPMLGGASAPDIHRVTVQVMVRSGRDAYEAGRQLSKAVQAALHKQQGSAYISWLADPPIQLGPDKKRRHTWSINLLVTYQA